MDKREDEEAACCGTGCQKDEDDGAACCGSGGRKDEGGPTFEAAVTAAALVDDSS